MLQMGFVEDVETILSAGTPASADGSGGVQTYLFSATMPKWVKSICQRFLSPGHTLVDLVGDDKTQVWLHAFVRFNHHDCMYARSSRRATRANTTHAAMLAWTSARWIWCTLLALLWEFDI